MENILLIDYLTISSKIDGVGSIKELFGLENCKWETGKACNGYKSALWFESIKILFDGTDDMGVCVELSGQGCRTFETFGHGDYGYIFDTVFSEPDGYNISRLDIAFDDHTGLFDFGQLAKDTFDGNYVSKSKTWSVTLGNKEKIIYHGSKQSDVLIRIYDKALERKKLEHWIRFELQLRREKAYNFARLYDSINASFYDVVFNYLRYIERTEENITRCPMRDYWQEFLGQAQRVSLKSDLGIDYNLLSLEDYVIKQAGNSIDTYIKIVGIDNFKEQLNRRDTILSDKHKKLLEMYT